MVETFKNLLMFGLFEQITVKIACFIDSYYSLGDVLQGKSTSLDSLTFMFTIGQSPDIRKYVNQLNNAVQGTFIFVRIHSHKFESDKSKLVFMYLGLWRLNTTESLEILADLEKSINSRILLPDKSPLKTFLGRVLSVKPLWSHPRDIQVEDTEDLDVLWTHYFLTGKLVFLFIGNGWAFRLQIMVVTNFIFSDY